MKPDTLFDKLLNWIDPSYPLKYALYFDDDDCVAFQYPRKGWVYFKVRSFMRFRLWRWRRKALTAAYVDGIYSRRRALLFYSRNRYTLSMSERPIAARHRLTQLPTW